MSLFSSDRERRLWIWTAVVVAAIYSTLGLARTLVDHLGSDFVSVWLFLLGCLLVLLTVVTQGLKVRPGGAEVAVALGVGPPRTSPSRSIPRISFGRPTITGSGVSTEALVNRIDAGESMEELAGDYGLEIPQIEHAIVYEKAA